MKRKQKLTPLFKRTLLAVFLFWLALMCVLTVNNYDRVKSSMEHTGQEILRSLLINSELVLEGTASEENIPAILSGRLSGESSYRNHALGVYRLYDETGTELARTQLARGSVTPEGTGVFSIYLHFDPVFSKQEHIDFARKLNQSDHELTYFYGYDSQDYGEVTGILHNNVMYPQKLEYCFKDRTVTLMESSNPMFDHGELTSIRFDHANIYSSLCDDALPPEKLWEMYWQANDMLDELTAEHPPSVSGSSVLVGGHAQAQVSHYYQLEGYPLGSAYVYTPISMMTQGLEVVYVGTFLFALLAAWYINHTQEKYLQRERELNRAVAHELKTPAAVIRAYAEALREDIAPERTEEYLTTLMEEADRMGTMVNELLELSRMQAGEQKPKWEPVDLRRVTEDCFERLRFPMQERGLEPELILWPCTCVGDGALLERVVSNLALNVLYHAKPGKVTVCLMSHGVLTVENCCDPIQEQVLERLWEPFYKGDTSRSSRGSGLGLAIVEGIIRQYGGTCSAGYDGERIRFRITLPVS